MSNKVPPWEMCQTCKYMEPLEQKPEKWNYCHKRAPMPSPDDGSPWWPSVKPTDWCGDWEDGR